MNHSDFIVLSNYTFKIILEDYKFEKKISVIILYLKFFGSMGFELRVSHLGGRPFTTFYHLSHTISPFCFGYFRDRVSFFAQFSLGCNLPVLVPPCPAFFY
jgi:hypothetical protein